MSDEARTTQFMPWITTGSWFYWPPMRIAIAVSFVGAFFLSLPLGMFWFGAILLFFGFVLISKAPNNRQYVYQLVAQGFASWREARHEKKRGPYRTKELRQVLFPDDNGGMVRESIDPVQPQFIPINGGEDGYLTEVSTPHNGRHTLFTLSDGFGKAVSNDPEGIVTSGNAFSNVLKEASADFGVGLFGALFFMRTPTDPEDAFAYFDRRLVQNGPEPEDEVFRRLTANYSEALAQQIQSTGDLRSGIGISVPRPRSWNKAKSLDLLTSDEISRAPGVQLHDRIAERLSSIGVSGVRRPNPYESTVLVRGGLDVATVEQLYQEWYVDRKNNEAGLITDFTDSHVMQTGMIPDDWSPGRRYLRIGDTFTRMFFTPHYPDPHVTAGLMQNLYNAPEDIWYGVSMIYETVAGGSEKRRNKVRRLQQDAKRIDRQKRGVSTSAEESDAAALTSQADALLYYGGGSAVKINLLSYVSSTSLDALDESEALLRKIFRRVNLPLQTVTGRSLQIPVRLSMFGIRSDKI